MIWFYLQPTPQHSTTIQASRMQVQALKTELELKTKVLLMPVDACVRHAMHGNTVWLMCRHADCMHHFAVVRPDAGNIEIANQPEVITTAERASAWPVACNRMQFCTGPARRGGGRNGGAAPDRSL
jgi:hypothetical protein